jgi:two-component system LytT family sensor kinase
MRSRYFTPGIHIVVWSLLLLVPFLVFQNQPDATGLPRNYFIITNVYHIGLFYLNAYYLYPRLLTKKWWWLYFIILAAIVKASYYIKVWAFQLSDPSFTVTDHNSRIIFFPPVAFLVASIIFRLIVDRISKEKREKEIQAERLDSELKLLRSQINPHFLFNMMTNMVALARQKSDLLEPSLIKLSDLLRYMLYGPGKEKLRMSEEIDYLKSYIELQQLRFTDTVQIQLDIKNEDPDCFIEPMLLVPFVENAFKHGIGASENLFINIQLQTKNKKLFFRVTNNYRSGQNSKDSSSGIGIVNVKNRLQLLYPGKHTIKIEDSGKQYQVTLNIALTC